MLTTTPRRPRAAAPIAAALAAILAGCSSNPTSPGNPVVPGGHPQGFVLTTDLVAGALTAIDVDTRQISPNLATVHSDATLRLHGGLIYVVNRLGADDIEVIDPGNGYSVRTFSTGNGSNPQDIAFASASKAYVTRYASSDLLIVDPRNGATLGTISLAAFADTDGLPEMAHLAIVRQYLFVACRRLTGAAASNPSVVVVIDIGNDKVVDAQPLVPGTQAITLTGRNPVTDFAYDPLDDELLIGCAGAPGALDGGIERIDPVHLGSRGFAITETALGGDVSDLAWVGPGRSYAIVNDVSVRAWSENAADTLGTVYATGGAQLADCAVNSRGELWVADRTVATPGVLIFHIGPDTLLAGPLPTGLPPNVIAFQ